jgi:integrase
MGRGRPPMALESWGKIARFDHYGTPAARASVRDSDGKIRRMIRTGRTHAEAERLLTIALRERLVPTYEAVTRESDLASLSAEWLKEVRRDKRAIATVSRYESTVRSHVRPVGLLRIREATVPRLQRLVNDVVDNSGPAAALLVIVVLKGMFELAIRSGALDENPVAHVKGPRRERRPVVAPGLDEIQMLRGLLAAHDQRIVAGGTALRDLADIGDVLLGTGARIGEIMALTWPHVDLDEGAVTIASTVVRIAGEGITIQGFPKSEASVRRLFVPDFTRNVLVRRRAESYCELVFPSSTGTPRWPENVRYQWSNALRGSPLEGLTPRACRKAVATFLEEQEDLEAAAGQLGNGSTAVTKRFYVRTRIDRADHSGKLNKLGKPSPDSSKIQRKTLTRRAVS